MEAIVNILRGLKPYFSRYSLEKLASIDQQTRAKRCSWTTMNESYFSDHKAIYALSNWFIRFEYFTYD